MEQSREVTNTITGRRTRTMMLFIMVWVAEFGLRENLKFLL
jgi:hypothetical protein